MAGRKDLMAPSVGLVSRAPTSPSLDAFPSKPRSSALRFCQEADGVVEGFLCSEPTVVSDACRAPSTTFDTFVCDDARMHTLQRTLLDRSLSLVKTILFQFIARKR